MSYDSKSTRIFALIVRHISVPALTAALLAAPLTPTWAQSTAKIPPSQTQGTNRTETVNQRIAQLHSELKITAVEEPDWQAVAQTMRANAAAIQKLAEEKGKQQHVTALEDLQTYADFAQAHVDGLKKLVVSFETLYNAMPDQQRKLADQVFENARRRETSRPS